MKFLKLEWLREKSIGDHLDFEGSSVDSHWLRELGNERLSETDRTNDYKSIIK